MTVKSAHYGTYGQHRPLQNKIRNSTKSGTISAEKGKIGYFSLKNSFPEIF
jgi:hypothetical protein